VGPTCQRLEGHNPVRLCIDNGLIVQNDQIALGRGANACSTMRRRRLRASLSGLKRQIVIL